MAKTMCKGKRVMLGEQKGRKSLERRMWEIDKEYKKTEPIKLGARRIILDAYNKNGLNGAMLALRIFNKRANNAYTWNDVEGWINEEKQKAGKEYGDD